MIINDKNKNSKYVALNNLLTVSKYGGTLQKH